MEKDTQQHVRGCRLTDRHVQSNNSAYPSSVNMPRQLSSNVDLPMRRGAIVWIFYFNALFMYFFASRLRNTRIYWIGMMCMSEAPCLVGAWVLFCMRSGCCFYCISRFRRIFICLFVSVLSSIWLYCVCSRYERMKWLIIYTGTRKLFPHSKPWIWSKQQPIPLL